MFVRGFVAEGGCEGLEFLFDFRAGEGFAVAGNKNARVEEREMADGESRVVPVGGEVGRGAVEFGRLRGGGVEEGLGLMVQKASPTRTVRSDPRKKETCPGVWREA